MGSNSIPEEQNEMAETTRKMSRRDALKILGAAAGASVLANLPSRWSTPQLASGVLPAHAQTSGVLPLVETISVEFLSSSGVSLSVSSVVPRGNGVRGPNVQPVPNMQFTGMVTDDGGSLILDSGFVCSESNPTPEIGALNTATVPGTPNPAQEGIQFTAQAFLPLAPQCWARAYATNAAGTGYGEVRTGSSGTI